MANQNQYYYFIRLTHYDGYNKTTRIKTSNPRLAMKKLLKQLEETKAEIKALNIIKTIPVSSTYRKIPSIKKAITGKL